MPQVGATPEKVLLQWVAVNSETPNWPKHRREVIVKYSAPSWDIFTIASEAQHASVTQEAGKNVSAGRCAVLWTHVSWVWHDCYEVTVTVIRTCTGWNFSSVRYWQERTMDSGWLLGKGIIFFHGVSMVKMPCSSKQPWPTLIQAAVIEPSKSHTNDGTVSEGLVGKRRDLWESEGDKRSHVMGSENNPSLFYIYEKKKKNPKNKEEQTATTKTKWKKKFCPGCKLRCLSQSLFA